MSPLIHEGDQVITQIDIDTILSMLKCTKQAPYVDLPVCQSRVINTVHLKHAAVLMPLIQRGPELHMLFIQRSQHLRHHPGQIAFPGGKVEPFDDNRVETALRETYEEIGIPRSAVTVLGDLPPIYTGTGYCVTPVVGCLDPWVDFQLDADEVAASFEVPLSFFLNPHHYYTYTVPTSDGVKSMIAIPWKERFIWGATAAMIRNFYLYLNLNRSLLSQ